MTTTYKVDLHTHSTSSHDGGIAPRHYREAIETGLLDCIAVTDHGTIATAQALHDELGDKIIVGEEIMAEEGEIIGLFLHKPIQSGLRAQKTIRLIKEQDGIVYIPHPFETVRHGLHPALLEELQPELDMIEVCNGRAFLQNRSEQAVVWARLNHVTAAASSDAHGKRGLGKTFTLLPAMPRQDTLMPLMRQAKLITAPPSLRSLLYPSYNRLRRKVSR